MDSVSAINTKLSKDYFSRQQQTSGYKVDNSQQMWDYRNRNTLDGVPVTQDASNLLVNNIEEARQALETIYNVKVWSGYVSPEDADKKHREEYQQILQRSIDSEVQILNQSQYFRADLGKIMLVITYAQLQMDLNPRYAHLKQEK